MKNMSEELTKDEFYTMLECVRCGSIENLKPYKRKFSRKIASTPGGPFSLRTETYIKWSNEFPVCGDCYNKFKKSNTIQNIEGVFMILGILLLIYGIFFLSLVLMISGLAIVVIGFALFLKSQKSLYNPSKYITVKDGLSRVRAENSNDWIPYKLWAESAFQSRNLRGNLDRDLLKKVSGADEAYIPEEIRTGNFEGAIRKYSEVSDKQDRALEFLKLAQNDIRTGNSEDAILKYSEIISLLPNLKEALFERGGLYAKFGQLPEALRDFEELLRKYPNFAAGWYNKSVVLNKLGRSEEARESFEMANMVK